MQPAKYPNAVEMHWKYAPDSKGMPPEKVVTQIAKFEATLDPLQGDRVGYLMMIVTGSGERTWLWYAADPKAFAKELNQLIPGHPFPITLNAAAKEPDFRQPPEGEANALTGPPRPAASPPAQARFLPPQPAAA